MKNNFANSWGFPASAPNTETPSSDLTLLSLDYNVNHGLQFHEYLVKIAQSHRENKALQYSYYGNPIGQGVVRIFVPSHVHDIEKQYLNFGILQQSLGEEEALAIITGFHNALISHESIYLQFMPNYSFLNGNIKNRPAEYIYYWTVHLKRNKNKAFELLLKNIIDNHKKFEHFQWVTYMEKHDSNIAHVLFPAEKYSEIEKIPNLAEILSLSNESEIQMIKKIFYSPIVNYKSFLLSLVSDCGNC